MPLTLSYSAPIECPDEPAVRAAVARIVTKQKANPLSVRVDIAVEGGTYTAHILPSDGTERVLTGQTCASISEAVEVVLALAISPSAALSTEASTVAQVEPVAKPVAPAAGRTPTPSKSSAAVRLELGTGAAADTGILPSLAAGLSARTGVTAHLWSALVEGIYWFPQRGYRPGSTTLGGDFSLWTVRPLGCAALVPGRLRLRLCAGPELGRLKGHGVGTESVRDATAFWLAADAWLELGLTFSEHWRARLGVGAALPLIGRHPFTLVGIGTVYQPDQVSVRGDVGVDFIF